MEKMLILVAMSAMLAGRLFGEGSALSYALRDGSHVASVDGYIMAFDSAYQYSSNRLEVLRSSLEWNINDYQRNYVTNAIHEIEAQLPPE